MVPLRGGILAALVLHHLLTVAVSNGVAVASYTLRSWLGNGYDVRRCIPDQCCATVAGGPDQAPNNQFAVPHGVALETDLDGSTIAHVIADRSDFSVQRCVAGENCTVVAGGNGRGSASNQNHPSDVAIDQAPNGTVLAYVVYDEVRQRVMRCGGTVGNYCVNATPPLNTQSASAAISLSKGPDGRLSHYIVTPRNGGVHSCDVDGSPCVQVVAPEIGQRKAVVEYSADGSVVAYVIAHTENHNVVRIGAGGGFSTVVVAGFGGQGGGANQLKAPTDVAIERFADGTPRAYIILDDGNDRVQRCAVGELSCTTTVDGKACGADGFRSAWAFAVEQVKAAQREYVSLGEDHCVGYDYYTRWCQPGENCGDSAGNVTWPSRDTNACQAKCDEEAGCVAIAFGGSSRHCITYYGACEPSGDGVNWEWLYYTPHEPTTTTTSSSSSTTTVPPTTTTSATSTTTTTTTSSATSTTTTTSSISSTTTVSSTTTTSATSTTTTSTTSTAASTTTTTSSSSSTTSTTTASTTSSAASTTTTTSSSSSTAEGQEDFSQEAVEVLDVATNNSALTGFNEGFQDGTYGYLVPYHSSNGGYRGSVARFDLATFTEVQALDVAANNSALKGFHGGFHDGTYGYLVPYENGVASPHGNVVRFDLANFTEVQALDVAANNSALKGFWGGFHDGTYGYLVPDHHVHRHGNVVRFDLATFTEVQVLDLAARNSALTGFRGGFHDDIYGYLVPYDNGTRHGNVVRFDLATFTEVQVLDVAANNMALKGFRGGFHDGTYGYLVPYENGAALAHGNVARFDLATFTQVQALDVAATNSALKGFTGGFHDGTYGYLVPDRNGHRHGNVARFDLANFTEVQVLDVAANNAALKGFQGGFHDGAFGYLVPGHNGVSLNGNVVRLRISSPTIENQAAQCSVGNLLCPIIEGQNYTVLGSETSGPPCTVQPGAASNFLSFATSECNTTTIKEATKETYFATLIPVNNGPIEFVGVGNVVLECRCEVITHSDAVANVSDVENTREQRGVNGFSDFVPELSVFVDDEYSIEWPDYVPGEDDSVLMNFYFQVESGDANDTVGLLNCTTAPSDDENDDLTYTLVDEDCDAGLFEVRRLESPSPHIARIATRAFLFSNQDRVHFRCAVVRCAAGDATCGSCGAGRRLSDNPTSPAKVVSVKASFPAPSSGSGVLQLGETEEMSATLHCTSALSALIYLVAACATLMVAA